MTRAILRVAPELLDVLRLPKGYREVWESPPAQHEYATFVVIDGPFPVEVADNSQVGAQLTSHADHSISWQWTSEDGRQTFGPPLLLPPVA